MRYTCIEFETNGFPVKTGKYTDWTLPFSSCPIQVSVDLVNEEGEVSHAYDTVIVGATSLAYWVKQNVPVRLDDIARGRAFEDVVGDLAQILQPGDTIVAHNASFDLELVLARTARRLGIDAPELHKLLQPPRFCTLRCAYTKGGVFGARGTQLKNPCAHFEVQLQNAHDATADSAALAQCVAEALRRGVMVQSTAH